MNRGLWESDYVNDRQVGGLRAAAATAREIGYPLTAHLTGHWSLTDAGDDPDGQLFARFRELIRKAFACRGICFAAVWARERKSGIHDTPEHFHLAFHLPMEWQSAQRQAEFIEIAERIIEGIAGRIYDHTLKLTLPGNGDIRYLLKGARPEVQQELGVKRAWRAPQGRIRGKRAGFTQNLGPASRRRYRAQKDQKAAMPTTAPHRASTKRVQPMEIDHDTVRRR